MDLWQLKIFCKVIELKSFSKAGEAVHLSQPTVSSHIKDLEAHFGTQLIDRLARNASPTKAGELLFTYAQRLIALQHETETAMAEYLGKIKGRLAIGGSTIPGGYLLPQLIGGFSNTFPEVHIALVVGDTSEILEKITSGSIELGVVGAWYDDNQLEQTPLTEDDLCIVVPAGHKWANQTSVTIADLINEPFIVRESGSGTLWSIEQQLQKAGHSLNEFRIVAEMGSTEAVRQSIKSKVGISILSSVAVADDVNAGTLKTLTVEGLELKRLRPFAVPSLIFLKPIMALRKLPHKGDSCCLSHSFNRSLIETNSCPKGACLLKFGKWL